MTNPTKEQHILVSTYSNDQQCVWHAYMVRRNPKKTDLNSDTESAYSRLADVVEQHDAHWLPMLMSTKIDNSSAIKLQRMLDKKLALFNAEPWKTYKANAADLFFAIFVMEPDDPECRELLDLH